MLTSFPKAAADAPRTGDGIIWFDLASPTEAERAEVEALSGLAPPAREQLSEIEASSRLRSRGGVLSMSMPMVAHGAPGEPDMAPIGFVLSRERLVTVRFGALASFDAVAARFDGAATQPASSLEVFVELCDEMVDHLADGLEAIAASLHALSLTVFHNEAGGTRQDLRSSNRLRDQLRQVGRMGDQASDRRDALLALERILGFAQGLAEDWCGPELLARMTVLRQDVTSLNDYQVQLTDKIQFLLDAMVGLIGISQNELFKVLTIVSIAGIPPTLVAGIYGMNFKGMPEYNWTFGYPYGLTVIALSAILPLVWFKLRGWF